MLTVPTALERGGDFSQTRNAAGQLVVIYDPLTTRSNGAGGFIRDPFPGNVIPANRLNPISRAMLANMPLPDSGRSFNGQATLDDGPQTQETVKVDQRWSSSWHDDRDVRPATHAGAGLGLLGTARNRAPAIQAAARTTATSTSSR